MGCNKETGWYRLWECREGRRSRLRWRRRWWGWQWCDNQWHIPSCNLHSACCPKEGSASKEPSSRCNWGWTDAGCVDSTNINACYQAVSPAEAKAESCCKLFSVNSCHEHKQKALCIILVPICNFQGLASRSDKLFGQIFEKNCLVSTASKTIQKQWFYGWIIRLQCIWATSFGKNSGESMKVLFKKFYSCFSLRLVSVTHLSIYPGACFHLFLRKTCSKALQLSNTGNHRIGILYSKTHKIIEILHLTRSRFLPVSN